ncbi:MAG TPA: NTP transferase domain-containing protein, partial [Nitrospirales bacterium]
MKAVILAAGVGKRLGVEMGNRPKCLIEIGGWSLLLRYLDALLDVGVKTVVLVVGHRQEMIRAAVGEAYRGLAVRYVV